MRAQIRKQETSDANTRKENLKAQKNKVSAQGRIDRGILHSKLSPKRNGPYQVIRIYSNSRPSP
jgi:hypothetical protein